MAVDVDAREDASTKVAGPVENGQNVDVDTPSAVHTVTVDSGPDVFDDAALDESPSVRRTGLRMVCAFVVITSVLLGGLCGWLGYGVEQSHLEQLENAQFV